MCMAIPMRVVAAEGSRARCVGRGGEALVDTLLTGPVEPGQWVLTFLGAARQVVSAEEAALVLSALEALEGAMAGDPAAVEAGFSDLVGREPVLPEFLRARTA